MGRISTQLLERAENFSHRVMDVADRLEADRRPRRVLDQMTGAGTSVGANIWEANEALSSADFCKILGIGLKELAETRFSAAVRVQARLGRTIALGLPRAGGRRVDSRAWVDRGANETPNARPRELNNGHFTAVASALVC